jgi:hypothetical protein
LALSRSYGVICPASGFPPRAPWRASPIRSGQRGKLSGLREVMGQARRRCVSRRRPRAIRANRLSYECITASRAMVSRILTRARRFSRRGGTKQAYLSPKSLGKAEPGRPPRRAGSGDRASKGVHALIILTSGLRERKKARFGPWTLNRIVSAVGGSRGFAFRKDSMGDGPWGFNALEAGGKKVAGRRARQGRLLTPAGGLLACLPAPSKEFALSSGLPMG